jgi:hypothetical protein
LSDKNNKYFTEFPNFLNQETSLVTHIEDVIDRFVQAGSANKGKTSGRFPESEETAF